VGALKVAPSKIHKTKGSSNKRNAHDLNNTVQTKKFHLKVIDAVHIKRFERGNKKVAEDFKIFYNENLHNLQYSPYRTK
jgi:hypothetical protein